MASVRTVEREWFTVRVHRACVFSSLVLPGNVHFHGGLGLEVGFQKRVPPFSFSSAGATEFEAK
jgi:hypothetical protein